MENVVAAAVDFKGWHMLVWLKRPPEAWPEGCACCGGSSAETRELKLAQARAAHPICASCLRHSKIDEFAIGASLAVGLVLPALAYYALMGLNWWAKLGFATLLLYAAAVLLTAGAIYVPLTKRMPGKKEGCADTSWPVEKALEPKEEALLGKDSERTDERTLRMLSLKIVAALPPEHAILLFRNYDYGRRFIQANGGDPAQIQRIEEAL